MYVYVCVWVYACVYVCVYVRMYACRSKLNTSSLFLGSENYVRSCKRLDPVAVLWYYERVLENDIMFWPNETIDTKKYKNRKFYST